jgi:hypothetical protein
MGNDMKQSFMGIGSQAGAWEPADIISIMKFKRGQKQGANRQDGELNDKPGRFPDLYRIKALIIRP